MSVVFCDGKDVCTGLVGHESPVSLGVFSRASFAIQPRPRLRTLLDGAGPQAPGVTWLIKTLHQKLYTFRPRTLRNVVGRRARRDQVTPAMRPQWPYYSVRRSWLSPAASLPESRTSVSANFFAASRRPRPASAFQRREHAKNWR
eukprot:scaffold54933_cov99-Phaeocystis_antarctica.AAC.2